MRYTTNDKGVFNNFTIEPVVKIAEYSATVEQHHRLWQEAIAPALTCQFAASLILGAWVTALTVS